jgi:hypothetical protein
VLQVASAEGPLSPYKKTGHAYTLNYTSNQGILRYFQGSHLNDASQLNNALLTLMPSPQIA